MLGNSFNTNSVHYSIKNDLVTKPRGYIENLSMTPVAGDDPNKQTRNETSRGVSQQVRLETILRVGKTRKPRKTKGDG